MATIDGPFQKVPLTDLVLEQNMFFVCVHGLLLILQ